MIKKMLKRIEEKREYYYLNDDVYDGIAVDALDFACDVIEEVAKEYDWIPVEQKTPEDFTNVYATCISLVDDREPWVIEGIYHSLTGWEEITPFLSWGYAKVIAWMPKKIPAPYQKGE